MILQLCRQFLEYQNVVSWLGDKTASDGEVSSSSVCTQLTGFKYCYLTLIVLLSRKLNGFRFYYTTLVVLFVFN